MGVEDRYKKKKEESKSNTLYNGVENRYLSQSVETIGKDITNRINNWLTNNKNYIDNAQYRFSDKNNSYRGDASDWLTTVTKQRENFGLEADSIKKVLTTYKDFFGEEYVSSVFKALDENLKIQDSVIEASTKDRDHWSQWDSEDAWKKDYDAAVAWQKDYDEKMSYDLEAGKTEIDRLNNILGVKDEITKLKNDIAILNQVKSDPYGTHRKEKEEKIKRLEAMEATWAHAMQVYGSEDAIRAMASEKGAYYTLAQRVQEGAKLGGVSDPESEYYDPNFEKYSTLGNYMGWEQVGSMTADKNAGGILVYDDVKAAALVMNERWLSYELFKPEMQSSQDGLAGWVSNTFGNAAEYNTENVETIAVFRTMTDAEINTFAYYLAKDKENGTNLAEQYVASLRETLNGRMAKKIAAEKETDFSKYLFAIEAGLNQYEEGRNALFSDADYIPTSPTQQASGIIRENLEGQGIPLWYNFNEGKWENQILGSSTGQIFYDSLNTTANMLPSVLASTVTSFVNPALGGYVGSVALGMSAAGNAKAEMLNLGYSKSQANAYGIMVGASEVLLEKFLGGIPGLSNGDGIFSSLGEKVLGKIDNALARAAITIGGNMLDEGLEEGLQTILEPWLKEITTSVDWEAANVDEVLYSSLLGALSSIGFGAADVVGGKINSNIQTNKYGQSIIDNGNVDSLKQLALEMYTDKSIAEHKKGIKLSEKVDKNASAKNVGKLATYMESTVATKNEAARTKALAEKGLSSIAMALTEKGLSAKVATKVAQYIMDSGKLSKIDKATIEGSSKIQKAINEVRETVNLDEGDVSSRLQDAIGTRQRAVKEIAERLAVDQAEADIESEAGAEFETSAEDVDLVQRIATERVGRLEGWTEEVSNAMIKGYAETKLSPDKYVAAWDEAHNLGKAKASSAQLAVMPNSRMLPESVRNIAYVVGAVPNKATKVKNTTVGNFSFDASITPAMQKKFTPKQKREVKALQVLAKTLGVNVKMFDSVASGRSENGSYDPDTRTIEVDIRAGAKREGLVLFTAAHEVTHHMRKVAKESFNKFADAVFASIGEGNIQQLVERKIEKLRDKGRLEGMTESEAYDLAYEEVVADAAERMLADSDALERLSKELQVKDKTLWEQFKSFIEGLIRKLKAAYAKLNPDSAEANLLKKAAKDYEGILKIWSDAVVEMSQVEDVADRYVSPVEETTKYSYRSLAEAAGFEAIEDENGTRHFIRDGRAVSKVTIEDIENSPIGAFINYSLDKNDITEEQAQAQKKLFADICTIACETNDFSMTMQFVGSAVFTGMKANADKQYGTTYDFPSICTKTQAVIDAMSKRMVKLGRGLTRDELVGVYQDVFASGNPVPCPECYVFSRWIGIGGLLDNIKTYQDYYGEMSVEEVAEAYKKMRSEVEAFAKEQGLSFGKAKGALTSKLTKEYNKLTEKIEKQVNQGEKVKDSDQKRLDELKPMMNTVKSMTWLENVYFADASLTKVNPRFRVPNEVLFDLNNGEAFTTKYPEAWAFRTTQGAGYGKAITPYAEASLGEGILVTNNTSNAIKGKAKGTLNNYFLRQKGKMDDAARKALDKAREKQKNQAFLGGQRFQSTSDARYENASDYLLAALEMQAMHGVVQAYTKVDGAVPAFANWGFSINQSLMPLGGGLDADGNVKDTSVGGMSPKVAFANRKKFETAGTITIGANDNHIRAMFPSENRDFIIPYHASGGQADVVAAFRAIQEGETKSKTMVRSTDYSKTQSDKILSDDVLKWLGKSDAEIEQIHKVREARIGILTRGKVDMDVVRGNRFLSALYDKLHGGEWDGVKIPKSKFESQIYPNEFWDQTVTYEESGKITEDYLEYCDDLGFLHRFSGLIPRNGMLVPVNGYDQNGSRVQLTDLAYQENGEIEPYFWKTLTDRRMYDNDGNYLAQKYVTLSDTTPDTVTNFAKINTGRQYDKNLSKKTAEKVASAKYSDRASSEEATAFVKHMRGLANSGGWRPGDVMDYLAEHPELDFVLRIFNKDKTAKADLTAFLNGIDSRDILSGFRWYISRSYLHITTYGGTSVYRGAVRTFTNAIDKRINALEAAEVGGTNLGIKNHRATVEEVETLFNKLNSNDDIGKVAAKVFDTVKRLGVNIRFVNALLVKGSDVAGDNVGDMVEYKTNYFNDEAVNDQDKAETLLHELIHACTTYAIYCYEKGKYLDTNLKQAVEGLQKIYNQVKSDPDFAKDYGSTDLYEMVAELSSGEFVAKLQKKNLWQKVLEWISTIFGFNKGTSLYDNAMMCLDYLLDNPNVTSYKDFSVGQRKLARNRGEDVFGKTVHTSGQVVYSDRDSYAPTFYSHMVKVIDDIKIEKMGAGGVVSYLKGRGVKDEEIKRSGIEAFLEGKKSVTKAELQEFVAVSQLRIEESVTKSTDATLQKIDHGIYEISLNDSNDSKIRLYENGTGVWLDTHTGAAWESPEAALKHYQSQWSRISGETKWSGYKLDGGSNYRELVFKLPNSNYSNSAMRTHWGDDAEGVLAHARIQDFDVNGKKMLFVEEIQSDWHNEGAKEGYGDPKKAADLKTKALALDDANKAERRSLIEILAKHLEGRVDTPEAAAKNLIDFKVDDRNSNIYVHFIRKYDIPIDLVSRMNKLRKSRDEAISLHSQSYELERGIPDAPFRNTYHEYVLKRLLRMAAEEGYDSIGWTTADIQSQRWSDEYAEGYRIEYDQDIPKFLRKYGKKWGATVEKTKLPLLIATVVYYDVNRMEEYETLSDWREAVANTLKEQGVDLRNVRWDFDSNTYVTAYDGTTGMVYDKAEKRTIGDKVWSMDIPDSMKDSILYEGQALYQDRESAEDSFSNRALLANALESVAANEVEQKKLAEYKSRIAMLDSETKKLSEIKKEIKELTFGEGKKNPERLKELRAEAVKTANRINFHDKKLLELEVTTALKNVIKREKEKAYQRAAKKGREALHRNVEGRNKTAMRHKIQEAARDLDSILNNGTKQRNVKNGEREIVRRALDLSEMLFATDDELLLRGLEVEYTDAEARAMDAYMALYEEYHSYDDAVTENKAKRKELRSQMIDLKKEFAGALERERKRISKAKAKDTFDALIAEYEKLASAKEDHLKLAYKPEVLEHLKALRDNVGDALVTEMTLEQLESVYKAFKMIKTMISDSNTIFRKGKKENREERKNAIFRQVGALKNRFSKNYPDAIGKALNKINEFGWNNLRPVDAFELIGSDSLSELFWDVIDAQSVYANDVEEAKAAIIKARQKYGYKNWNITKTKSFKMADGRMFTVTLGEMMAIYAYSKRDQADGHMREGGFQHVKGSTYKDEKGIVRLRTNESLTYRVDDKMRLEIIDSLTKEQQAYATEIQELLTSWGEKGNEASRILYGIDLFNEEIYFPLQSSHDYLSSVQTEIGQTATTASLAGSGMTKPTKPHANNPIMLQAFDDIVLEHLDRMSKYHAYVVPIDNLRKMLDAQGMSSSDDMMSLKALIGEKLGVGAKEYLQNYITDLNGSASTSGAKNPLESFFGKAKGAAVSANLSVWVQQYFSVIRAFSIVNPKYFIPFIGEQHSKGDMKAYEELKKYAPIATIKEMGGFDVGSNKGINEYVGYEEARVSKDKISKGMQDAFGIGANLMDKLGWITIWRGVKKEVAASGKYKVGSEEYFNACGKRFEEVIVKTQVYDSVNARSGYMRSKNGTVKYLVSFMGEPTTIVGMVEVAIIKLERAIQSKDNDAMKKATAGLVATMSTVAISTAMTSIAKSLVYAMRDDDEDEAYLEKYAESLAKAFKDDINLLNYLPVARDIASIFEGRTIERPDMTLIEDAIDSYLDLVESLGDEDALTEDKIKEGLGLAGAIANLLGVPAKNIWRDLSGIVNTVLGFGNGYDTNFGQSFVEGWTGEEAKKGDNLYSAIVSGDTERVEHYKSTYKTTDAYESAVRKALRENDSRIKEAAQARYEGNISEYTRIAREIVSEGHFKQDDVVAAINAELNAIKRGEVTEEVETEGEDEVTSIYSSSDINVAFNNGDTDMALEIINELIETKMSNGMEEKNARSSLRSSMTSYWKPLYKEAYKNGDTQEMYRIRTILLSSGLYGKTSDVIKTAKEWLKS